MAVAALVAACPCALVLATPAAITAGIARLAPEGVLVKGGAYIESLARVRTVVFDKTGTLTEGRPRVRELVPAPGIDEDELLAVAASAERSSEHLLGRAIVAAGRRRNLSIPEVSGFAVRPGLGVEACVNGRKIRVGNLPLVREALGSEVSWMETTLANHSLNGQTAVAVTADGKPLGIVSLRDCPRPEAAGTVSSLKAIGIRRICMMTGDEEAAARYVGREAGIDEIYSRLLPEEKAKTVLQLRGAEAPLLMVGDGVNDSPSLASADVGIAMGRRAADISAEAAHVVFLKDRLSQIPDVIVYARRVIRRIRTSIILFAFGVNAAAVLLAAFGYLGPAVAAVVHQSASLFVILNCVRLLVEGKAVEEPPLSRVRVLCQQRLHHLLSLDQFRRLVTLDAGRRRTLRRWLPRIALACWLISGLVLITPEQVGVVQRFGRHIPPDLGPGLHYRWPWPVEAVTRLAVRRLRVVEIGYRTDLSPSAALEPRAYEWNTQHRLGRYRKAAEEGLILTGDENLVEINAVVQYGIGDPALYLFHVKDPETLIRTVAEQSLRLSAARQSLDAILTNGRVDLERDWTADLKSRLAEYQCGLEVLSANLQDVHPPVEVVEAFRDVASAQEERSTLINEAEGYMREQLPRARGQSRARLLSAEGYSAARIDRSRGDSSRFNEQEQAYRTAPDVTARRLYLETVEKVLPNKAKYIVDSKKAGRRRFLFLDSTGLNLLNVIEPQTAKPK